MLLMHILNFYIGQLTIFNALLNRLSRRVRVDMDGYILSVIRDGDALADSFEICAQLADILVALAAGDELRAVGVAAVCGVFVRFLFAFRFLRLVHCLAGILGRRADNGEDRTLCGLHDRFICRGTAMFERGGYRCTVSLVKTLEPLGNSAEYEREDNAGVASCAAQQT